MDMICMFLTINNVTLPYKLHTLVQEKPEKLQLFININSVVIVMIRHYNGLFCDYKYANIVLAKTL